MSANIAFARGGAHLPIAHALRLLSTKELQFVRVKLGYPPNFNFLGKPLLGEKYVEGKKKEDEDPFRRTRYLINGLLVYIVPCSK